jgi:SAM-dependent methyltransferase
VDKSHKKKTLDFYNKLFVEFGYDPRSLGWGTRKGKQSVQFEALCQIGNLSGCSILDVGCGFGDLHDYLKFRGTKCKYFGVDINQHVIEMGKSMHKGINLEVRDIQTKKFKKKFDWVFFSGISSAGCTYPYIEKMMKEMFQICKKGIALNFVGGVVDFKSDALFYSDPEKIYSITRKISNRVIIRHDYAPYQYVLYMYKDERKSPNHVFKDFIETSKISLDDSLWHSKFQKLKPSKNQS